MTTPDWEPIMNIAGGIVTDKGGRTCHAAIVAREIGVVCIVGTGNATSKLKNDDLVTINCSENEKGSILKGLLKYEKKNIVIKKQEKLPIQLMLNIGSPENVYSHSLLPQTGVGLTRLEFIMNSIKIHPLSAVHYPNIPFHIKREVEKITRNQDPKEYFVNHLAKGIGKIASAFYPHKIIVRLSDFKSNEYCNLIGGKLYEPNEENPMIGWRGASRYYSSEYKQAFKLECLAIKYVIENMKLDNIIVMIPFCRTPEECRLVLKTMKEFGLERGYNN
jgi:pyruvate,water dikinase